MNSPIWSALYFGGLAVILAVSAGMPEWVVVVATLVVLAVYGLHLRLALRMLDEWYERIDRDAG